MNQAALVRFCQLLLALADKLHLPVQLQKEVAVESGVFRREHDNPASSCPPSLGRLRGGLGSYGVLLTDTVEYVYGHLAGFALPDGSHVERGQTIGYEGDSGCATGPHVHFEVRRGGRAIDPCPYLPRGYPSPLGWSEARCWGAAPP